MVIYMSLCDSIFEYKYQTYEGDEYETDVSLSGALRDTGKIRFVISIPDFVYVDSLIMHILRTDWARMTENIMLHTV